MKKNIFLFTLAFLAVASVSAQSYIDGGANNNGGLYSDWTSQGFVTAAGSYSTSGSTGAPAMFGVFEHYGPSGNAAAAALRNDGAYDATTFGRDYFFGPAGTAGQQAIGGTTRPRFAELYLNNGAIFNIDNTNGSYIGTAVYYNNSGFLTTTDRTNPVAGSIFMAAAATQSITLSDNHYVDGYVTRLGGTALQFSVGSPRTGTTDARYLSTGDNTGNGASSSVSVAEWNSDAALTTDPTDGSAHARGTAQMGTANGLTLASVTNRVFWDFEFRSGVTGNDNSSTGGHAVPTVDIPVTVSIPDMSGTGGYAAGQMVLVGWDAVADQWIPLSGTLGTVGGTNGEGEELTGTVPAGRDITAISIGSTTTVLPVVLQSFTATADNSCGVELVWKSASELNSSKYVVEYSTNGTSFTAVAEVVSKNSAAGASYSYTYTNAQNGTGYYRLRMVDRDGSVKYSEVVSAAVSCAGSAIVMAPNPVTTQLMVRGVSAGSLIEVYSNSGALLSSTRAVGSLQTISMQSYPAGTYLVRVIKDNKAVAVATIIKQ